MPSGEMLILHKQMTELFEYLSCMSNILSER